MIRRGRKPGEFNQLLKQLSNRSQKAIRPQKFKDDKTGKLIRVLFPLAVKIFDLPEALIECSNHLGTKAKEYEFKLIISEVPNSWKILQETYRIDCKWMEKLENDLEIIYLPGELCREELYENLLKSIFEYARKWKPRKNKENIEKKGKIGGSQTSLRVDLEDSNKTASFALLMSKGIDFSGPDLDRELTSFYQLNQQNE